MKSLPKIGESYSDFINKQLKSENRKFFVGIFLVIVVLFAIFILPQLLKQIQDIRQRANNDNQKFETAFEKRSKKLLKNKIDANNLTRQAEGLINNIKAHNENKEKTSRALSSVLEARKQNLIELMRDDPTLVQQYFFADDYTKVASEISQDNVEKKVTVSGFYSEYHIHAANGGEFNNPEETKYFNKLTTGEKEYNLFGEKVVNIKSESIVTVTGSAIGNNILVDSISPQNSNAGVQGASNPTTMKIAVIGTKFTDTPANYAYTLDDLRKIFYQDPANNIIDYFKEASYGNLTINPSFFGVYTLPYSRGQGCADNDMYKKMVDQADADIDYTQFSRIMFIRDCPGYMAAVFPTLVTQDGTFTNLKYVIGNSAGFEANSSGPTSMPSVMSHEIAHTLPSDPIPLLHANYYNCTPDIFTPPSNLGQNFGTSCNNEEYGDYFDLLGLAGNFGHLNANYKYVAGWMSPANYPTINSSGTYTIAPLESNSSAVQGLYIPRGTDGGAFSVEFRQPIGYDAKFADNLKCPGCNVTAGPSIKFLPKISSSRADTKALDTTPNSPFAKNDYTNGAALTPGNTFTDPEYGISIKTLSANSAGANVDVYVAQQSCKHNPPTVTISPNSQTVTALESKNYVITVQNNDTVGCQPGIFGISFIFNNPNLYYSANPSYLTIAPQANAASTMTVTGKETTTDGRHLVYVSVISNAYGIPTVHNSVEYVLNSASDTISPTSPSNLTATLLGSSQVKLDWSPSTDNTGVVGYKVFRDGSPTLADAPSYIDLNLYPGITYSYYIQAYDRKGNVANSQTITVTPPARTDFSPPSACSNLQETYTNDNGITLSWSPSTDNVGISLYHVMGSGFEAKLPPSKTSFTVNKLPLYTTKYSYLINVYDGDGGNNYCEFVFYTGTPGNNPPLHPKGLSVTNPDFFKARLTWNPNQESDISYYNIFRNDRKIGTTQQTVYEDYVSDNSAFNYTIQAVDQAGNRSALSDKSYIYILPAPSGQPYPPIPTAQPTQFPTVAPTSVPLLTATPTPIPITPTRIPTPLPPTPTTSSLDTTNPIVAITSPLAGSTVAVKKTISLTASASDNVQVAKVEFYINNILNCTDTSSPFICSWKVPATKNKNYSISAKAYDAAGNNSTATISVIAK